MLPKYQEIKSTLQRKRPELYAALNPRIYRGADKWESPSVPAVHLGANLEAFTDPNIPLSNSGDDLFCCLVAITATKLMQHAVPTFFVELDLLLAVSQTDPPPDAKWPEMRLPFPAGVLMLPKGAIRDELGHAFNYVTWCRIAANESVAVQGLDKPFKFGNDALVFSSSSPDDPIFAGLTKCLDATTWPHARMTNSVLVEQYSNLTDSGERDILNTLSRLALGLLMVFEAKPKLHEAGRRLKAVKQGGEKREVWAPRVLGAGYRIEGNAGGTHASPRLHWRRGCWRQQACGPKHSERKTIWIEPVLVNAES